MLSGKAREILFHAAAVLLFSYAFVLSIKPVSDSDLFWHLNSGKWAVEHRAFPDKNLFTYTSQEVPPESVRQGLRSQWLGQVIFYLVYRIGGYPGISFFRALLIVLPFAAYYVLLGRRNIPRPLILSFVALPLFLIISSLYSTYERPQAFTFMLTVLTVWILISLKKTPERAILLSVLLAPVMMLWSNLHGGFIIGLALVAIFSLGLFAEGIIYERRLRLRSFMPLLAASLGSLMNPNTYRLAYGVLRGYMASMLSPSGYSGTSPSVVLSEIYEYKSLWFYYEAFNDPWIPYMLAFMAMCVLALAVPFVEKRRVDLPVLLTSLALCYLGVFHLRGASIALIALPLLALSSFEVVRKPSRLVLIVAMALLTSVFLVSDVHRAPWQYRPSVPQRWVHGSYPASALAFIQSSGLKGRVFNELGWGGYIAWEMPGTKVFIDGRLDDMDVFSVYRNVIRANSGWSQMLDAFSVDFILTYIVNPVSGRARPFVLEFLDGRAGAWRLVFFDFNAALFVKDTPENARVISQYSLPPEILYIPMLEAVEVHLRDVPGNPNALLTKAIALYGRGMRQEAESILTSLPPSPLRDRYLLRIKQGR